MQNNRRYKSREKQLLNICKSTAGKIKKYDVDEFEVFTASSVDNEIEIFKSKIETLSFSDSIGVGIRIFKDKSVGYAYTTVLEDSSMEDCIERAVSNSKITGREKYNYLPVEEEYTYKKKLISDKLLFRESLLNYRIEDKVSIAKKLEDLTRSRDKRISDIENVSYQDSIYETAILNSEGFCDNYKKTTCMIYVNAISREGNNTSTGDYFGCGRSPDDIDLDRVADKAAERSVSILGGEKIKSDRVSLLLGSSVSAQFLSVIADGITADSVQKKKSVFGGKIGERIFSADINIFDDGTLPEGLSSRPFDGEGVVKGRTGVFEKGCLKTYLYDTFTARKDKTLSTGNAVRASYRSTPEVGISNFYIEPSKYDFNELLRDLNEGFYVIDIIGMHSGVNNISGQISVGAKGLWMKNGKTEIPVKEVTIATDILSFCKSIEKAGRDLEFFPLNGYIGSPSLLLRNVTISGR
ncbi:MAG: TldD/PmbA family protein [Actinomycetota bacterium]|nr:TldD/PmbA family protein [Actinomycetota bacterium]